MNIWLSKKCISIGSHTICQSLKKKARVDSSKEMPQKYERRSITLLKLQQFILMHLLRGWHFLCRKENTIRVVHEAGNDASKIVNFKFYAQKNRFIAHIQFFMTVNHIKWSCSFFFCENCMGFSKWAKSNKSSSHTKHFQANDRLFLFFWKTGHVAIVPLEQRGTVSSEWYTTICLPVVFQEIRKTNRQRRITHLKKRLMHS